METEIKVSVAWYGKHFGEEPPICFENGSGTVFFSGCDLRCLFCQNFEVSQQKKGREYSVLELSRIFLELQKNGAENINFVSPNIWYRQIREALILAKKEGFSLPVVWNSNGFEGANRILAMKGFVDIWLPDFKYASDELARKYSGIKNYVNRAIETISAMLVDKPEPVFDSRGKMLAGVVIRHLVLPGHVQNSMDVLDKIYEIKKDLWISLMCQYFPTHKALEMAPLNRTLKVSEWKRVTDYFMIRGFEKGWVQELGSHQVFCPDFEKENPFSSNCNS